jgi:rod shape-determining protein MreD
MDALYYLFTLLLIGVGLLQSALLPYMRIAGVLPDLMLALVVAWSLLRRAPEGLIWALVGGLVLDLLSGAPFGVFTLGLVSASLIASASATVLFRSYALLPVVAIVPATLVYHGVVLLLLYAAGRQIDWLATLSSVTLPALPVNLGLMLLVFPLARWLHRQTAQGEVRW